MVPRAGVDSGRTGNHNCPVRNRRLDRPRRARNGRALLAAAAAGACLLAPAGPGHHAGAQPRTALTYALADTWSDEVVAPRGGLYEAPVDISSGPDGSVYVLSPAEGLVVPATGAPSRMALHAVGLDGAPRSLTALDAELAVAARLDAGFDGAVHVLGVLTGPAGSGWGVARYTPRGAFDEAFPLQASGHPADIAASPLGPVYVSMRTVTGDNSRLDAYGPNGELIATLDPSRLGAAGPDGRFSYQLDKLDIHPDGSIFVMAYAWRDCPVNPGPTPRPQPTRTPAPTPTPRPSLAGGAAEGGVAGGAAEGGVAGGATGDGVEDGVPWSDPGRGGDDGPQQLPCRKWIVLEFDAQHRFRGEWDNSHRSDIAAGVSGVYVAASTPAGMPVQYVYKLGARTPTFRYRLPQAVGPSVGHSASNMQLDIAHDGRLLAITGAREPFYRGALALGDPRRVARVTDEGQTALGLYNRPPLSGPRHPWRIDAGADVLLLEAPYAPIQGRNVTPVDPARDVSAIVRWTLRGVPVWQAAHHGNLSANDPGSGGAFNMGGQLVDLALDGTDIYAVSPQVVWHRPDALPPTWYHRVAGAHLIAASADGRRVAVLDGVGRRVLILGAGGSLWREWPVGTLAGRGIASDLAYAAGRVYLADQGRNRIVVRSERGADLGEWRTHDGPRRVAVGPEGDVYVLGRGGYGLRYTPEGELVAAWRMPQRHAGLDVDAQDLAVGDDGRVYVSFLGLSDGAPRAVAGTAPGQSYHIHAAGVWVFEPEPVDDPAPPPDHRSCLASPVKSATPKIILQGETVDVELRVDGLCPGRHAPQQMVIVLDTSWSMHDAFPGTVGPGGLSRAKDVLAALLESIDPETIEIGLITFSGGGGIDVPLPGDLGDVRARILSRVADGDTRMAAGIELAHAELRGPRGDPEVKQTILVVSDGVFKDDPKAAVNTAAADGIEVLFLVTSTPELDAEAWARLEVLAGGRDRIFLDPVPATVPGLIDRVAAYIPEPGLFRSITVEDVVPANMAYLEGSARPAALWDPSSRTLTWTLGAVAAEDGVALTYRLRPVDTGTWPTNVRAGARYLDVLGGQGRLTFGVPWVLVLRPDPLATATPLVTATPVPPTATPTATKVPWHTIYLPLAARSPVCIVKRVEVDVVLVLDMSTSMERETGAGRSKRDAALAAARQFVDQLGAVTAGRDRVAVVGFNDRAWTAGALGTDLGRARAAIAALPADTREGTRLDLALEEALRALGAAGPAPGNGNVPAVVLLTDGLPNRVPTPVPAGSQEDTVLAAAERLKAAGAVLYTVGLGHESDVRGWMLRLAASAPELYYETPDAEQLAAIYERILMHLVCGND